MTEALSFFLSLVYKRLPSVLISRDEFKMQKEMAQ